MTQTEQLCQQGLSLLRQGDATAALERAGRALALDPGHAGALFLQGMAERALGHAAAAVEALNRATLAAPDAALYQNGLGLALHEAGRWFEARNAFASAVALQPDFADARANLALSLFLLQEPAHLVEEAAYAALTRRQDHDLALHTLALLRGAQGRRRERAALLQRQAARPGPEQWKLLARAALDLAEEEEFGQAHSLLARALRLAPEEAEVGKAYGECLGEAGHPREARAALGQAAGQAGGRDIWRYRHLGYCPDFFANAAAMDEYWEWLQAELDSALARAPRFSLEDLLASGFAASFNITHLWRPPRPALEKIAALLAPSLTRERPEPPMRLKKTGRIRLGFVIPPRGGAGFARCLGPLVSGLDPRVFERMLFYPAEETALLAALGGPGVMHAPCAGSAGKGTAGTRTFADAARRIDEAGCDMLLHWKAGENPWTLFLPLMRLAPVQCTSWGTHGTSGIGCVDYSVSWDLAELPGAGAHYAETLVRLTTPPLIQPLPGREARAGRADLGLPGRGTLYFCPHRLAKYHPDFDQYLKEILDQDSGAHILLLMYGRMPAREQTRRRIIRNVGPLAARRLLFMPRALAGRFYQIMGACDVMLASPSYDGSLTPYDAFCRGRPVVTQLGELLINRYTSAYYRSMGIADAPVARNREEYVRHALKLSREADFREDLGRRLAEGSICFAEAGPIVEEWARFLIRAVEGSEQGIYSIF